MSCASHPSRLNVAAIYLQSITSTHLPIPSPISRTRHPASSPSPILVQTELSPHSPSPSPACRCICSAITFFIFFFFILPCLPCSLCSLQTQIGHHSSINLHSTPSLPSPLHCSDRRPNQTTAPAPTKVERAKRKPPRRCVWRARVPSAPVSSCLLANMQAARSGDALARGWDGEAGRWSDGGGGACVDVGRSIGGLLVVRRVRGGGRMCGVVVMTML